MKKSLLLGLFISFCSLAFANNMLVQNVTTTGNNATNQTIQVQFDISWDNSWRDAINWDAAWIFIKFKDANGLWQHAQLNQTGFTNGSGTANTLQVTSDRVGSWLYRSALGSGTFNSTGMQLQWNYGLSGLTNVTGLEVRVFAVEMVYVPEGDFNCAGKPLIASCANGITHSFFGGAETVLFTAPGNNFPVINTRLSPPLSYSLDQNNGATLNLRIKGDVGLDYNNDGVIDNTNYPTGFSSFFCYKYELTEQQYADFLNTLSGLQISNLGIAGSGITVTNGVYFSSTPNNACNNATDIRILSYADWSGLRPMSFLELNKSSYGPLQPIASTYGSGCGAGYPAWGSNSWPAFADFATTAGYLTSSTSNRVSAGASYYGILELSGSASEPVVNLNYNSFSNINGNGILGSNGITDIVSWNSANMFLFVDQVFNGPSNYFAAYQIGNRGFRYVRSAE
jgi:hypothetical protein